MKVKLILKNELGEFESNLMEINSDQYERMVEMSRNFYSSGFEMYLEDGFLVAPPEVVKKSILLIKILEQDNGNQEKI